MRELAESCAILLPRRYPERKVQMAELLDFTIRRIEAIPTPTGGRIEYRDTKEQGLYLRVTPRGVKSFSFVGRAKGAGRTERLTIGKFPQVKPEEARTRARELAGQLAGGVSVATVKREKKGELTVGDLWDLYFAYIGKTNKDPGATEVLWKTYVEPKWSKRRLSEVSALAVEKWHLGLPAEIMKARAERAAERKAVREARRREIAWRQALRRRGPDPKPRPEPSPDQVAKKVTGNVSANKAIDLLRAMYNFALDGKRRYFTGVNPAAHHKPFSVPERERFLQADEVGPFFEALAQEPSETMRDAILIALLTGQRRANVLAMRWSNVNLERAEWSIPGEVTKNGQPHVAPLVPEAVELLRRRAENKTSVFVFPSTKSKTGHIGEPKKAWKRLLTRTGFRDLIVHDLRRTLGSWQARNGASLVMIGKSLNHKTPEATAIYARLDMDPVRQSVTGATSAMFEAAGVKAAAKVIPMPKRKREKKQGRAA